ncbi:MAG: hypothetical protein CL917_12300 [Deltaproteobacteria bacterium]|nr:hypothetical protein [Deltaproteobacteria bacterium]
MGELLLKSEASGLAVFCDFDGTLSVQDVGSQIAQMYLSKPRAELGVLFKEGQIDAWEYAVKLFDGFHFSSQAIHNFLQSIDLDPGARDLLDWCDSRAIPFQILSDGFDYNLNELQVIHDIQFSYRANHLRLEGDIWRLSPGGRNSACSCGTGLCKRTQIETYRQTAPEVLCVHIGNGRVSDLCGAEAADVAFAKETLAEALAEREIEYYTFETLHDVILHLQAWYDSRVQ